MAFRIRNVAKRSWILALRVIALLLILVAITLGLLLGTEAGRVSVAQQAAIFYSLYTGSNLKVSGLRSESFGRWEIQSASWSAPSSGMKIQVDQFSLSWRWRFALKKQWWLPEVSVNRLELDLLDSQSSASSPVNYAQLWRSIPALRLEQLQIDHFIVNRERYPSLAVEVTAQADLNWGETPARFIISVLDKDSTDELALQLNAEGIDQLRFRGAMIAAADEKWAQWLSWSLDQDINANWNVLADYSEPNHLKIGVTDSSLPWGNHNLTMLGKIDYLITEQQFNFDHLAMQLDGQPASINGWINESESQLDIDVTHWTLSPLFTYFNVANAQASVDGSLRWFGGWRSPSINGLVDVSGSWNDVPISANILSEAKTSAIAIENAQIIAGDNSVSVTGNVDWASDNLQMNYEASVQRGDFIETLFAQLPTSLNFSGQVEGSVEGALNNPQLSYTGKAGLKYYDDQYQASFNGVANKRTATINQYQIYGDQAQLNGQASIEFDNSRWQTDVRVDELNSQLLDYTKVRLPVDWRAKLSGDFNIEKNSNNFSVTGDANLLGEYQQQPLNAQLTIRELNNASISLGDSTVRIGSSFVQGLGSANWRQPNWDFDLTHQDFDLAIVKPWVPQWPALLESLSLNLTGETVLSNVWSKPLIETVSSYQGEWFQRTLTGTVTSEPQSINEWQISQFEANWFGSDFLYQGKLDPFNLEVQGDLGVTNWPLAEFISFNQTVLNRPLAVPDALTGDMTAQLNVDGSLAKYLVDGDAQFIGTYDEQSLAASVDIISLTPEAISLANFSSQWSESRADLSGQYDWQAQQYAINLDANVSRVEPLVELAIPFIADTSLQHLIEVWRGDLQASLFASNETGSAYLEGDINSSGQWFDLDYQLQWQGAGTWQDLLNQQANVTWGDATFTADVELNEQKISGAVSVDQLSVDQLKNISDRIPTQLSGIFGATIDMSGTVTAPIIDITSDASGQWLWSGTKHPWETKVDAQWQKQGWSIDQARVAIDGGGHIDLLGSGQGLYGQVTMTADIPQTAYWIPDSELGPGRSNVELVINGDLLKPNIELDASWQAEIWPVRLTSTIRTADSKVSATTTVFSDGLNRLKATLETPQQSWAQWQSSWQETPISASVAILSPFSVLDPFFVDRPDQSVNGVLAGQLDFNGTFLQPNWQGAIDWNQGRFENISTGTSLDQLELTVSAQENKFSVTGSATDGRTGTLELSGGVQLNPSETNRFGHEFDLNFKVDNANLINDSQIDATMTGEIDVTGQYWQMLVSGAFDVSPLNLQTDTFLLDGVPQLNIVPSVDYTEDDIAGRPTYWPSGQWDVELTASSRANLYGQGISAELAGSMQLLGDFSEPTIAGRFNVVRGSYSGLGKVFSVTGGSVQIQNNQLVFNVEANYEEAGLDVTLLIAGTQDELTVELSSVPVLDQNELLAQLVFGQSIADISEFQAIQLAYMVNNIRTGTTSFDLIGATRQELTLDALIIDPETDEEGNLGVNIRAGKYLNNYLYLEVEQNVGSEEGFRSSLQLQVSPNTYLELFAEEALGSGGAELNWSVDY